MNNAMESVFNSEPVQNFVNDKIAQYSQASQIDESNYLDVLKKKSLASDEWLEKYLNFLDNREALSQAQDYDKWVRSNSFQLMAEDLRKAGLNPYFALNSLGGSSGSSMIRNTSGYNANSAVSYNKANEIKLTSSILSFISSLLNGIIGSGASIGRGALIAGAMG